MEYRNLGRSGLLVSEITYGNWITHGSQIDDEAARATVHAALDAGITTFDTADVYADTRAEQVLGQALAGQRREGLEICTKVYFPTGPGVNDRGLSRKHVMESINGSLRRLQTDYVDLYQAHRFDYFTPLEETLRAFDDLVRSGKVLYVGVSEWTAGEIREAARIADEMGFDRLVSNQPQYSMLHRVIEAEVVPACEELGVGQIVWSPVAQGVLTGKYLPGGALPGESRAVGPEPGSLEARFLNDATLAAVQGVLPIAADLGLTPAQMAIAWVLRNPNVASAIIGASRPDQVAENARAAGVSLPLEALEAIDAALGAVAQTDPRLTTSPNPRP
jgi:aryl-alcohol dehydrogenase-like predicted oxidoreductase